MSEPDSNRVASPDLEAVARIRAFAQFHVRLSLLYGSAVVVTFALLVAVFYGLWAQSEKEGLQRRLLDVATTIAAFTDADAIAETPLTSTARTPLHEALYERFRHIASRDAEIHTIYILRRSDTPGHLYFFVDYVKAGKEGEPGELYVVENARVMLNGLEIPSVEEELYEDEFGRSLSAYAPLVTSSGERIGLVGLDVRAEEFATTQGRVLTAALVIFILFLLLIALLSLIVARSIRDPLARLIRATGEVARGNLDIHLDLHRRDEFGLLADHFDDMVDDLREQQLARSLFGQYMSEDVARSLLSDDARGRLGGEQVVVTVLFCDLKSYSTISERLAPEQLVGMLNEYLGEMNDIIDRHDGCVIEFLGDAILAAFGTPQPVPEHAEQAVRCALEMRAALEALNGRWRETGLDETWIALGINRIECRIGLHTGMVTAGNLGSKTRMKYGIIGDAVNLAARIEALNTDYGTTILMSEPVRNGLAPELKRNARRIGKTLVKGRATPVTVFSV